mgnify:CR=1 FL=1
MNYFSLPMPYDTGLIDKLCDINQGIEKSRIVSMYNGLSTRIGAMGTLSQERISNDELRSVEAIFPYIEKVHERGLDFVFLLNGVKIPTDAEFERIKPVLYKSVSALMSVGVKDFRVANTLMAQFLSDEFPGIRLRASTCFEFQSVRQYHHLFESYPAFVEVVPSFEQNHNFEMLKSIRKLDPDIIVELMANEGCIAGCPFRGSHNMLLVTGEVPSGIYHSYCKKNCQNIYGKDFWTEVFRSNVIYPWQIGYYQSQGFDHFKLVGRNMTEFKTGEYVRYYEAYLMGVEDVKNILDKPFFIFSNYFVGAKALHFIKVRDVIDYLPRIEYFKKYGQYCPTDCMTRCNYCKCRAEAFENRNG